jgi:protein TonB
MRKVAAAGVMASAPGSRLGVGIGLLASLALHAVLAMGVLNVNVRKPAPQRDQLVVQYIGMVGNRQAEQKQRGDDIERNAPKAPAPPPQKAVKKTMKKAMAHERPAGKALSPVKKQPGKTETKPKPEQQPEQQVARAAPPASEQTMPKGAEAQQVKQTLKPRESELSLIRKYLAGLTQEIQDHLEYPREARDAGYVGAPTIRFTITESGDILPTSLSVHKSSGSALLDEKALQAAQAAAPMAKPPRQMTVTITVAFTQDG